MKFERQEKILELIEKNTIETQEELLQQLQNAGFKVTQATISRDIRELKLLKGMTPGGGYKYITSNKVETSVPRFNTALTDSILKIDYAGNLIVIKTYSGMANAVATCIDSLDTDEIVGCVAGDDAILVVIKDVEMTESICSRLKNMIHNM